jgi:NADPH-dependent 2,4-dienoyl-CoA reductase/sulfur reductase-like enzyme/nitrite reductase/ring-hydroxylating ferredoxin subunit
MKVRVQDLADGAMIAGKVGEEDVLLARRGDELFAVSAHCTHYHGPLAEGLMVGETVRCPWHHACFDLRTGSAIGAPALRPLKRYDVIREGDVVRVSGGQAILPVQDRQDCLSSTHIVILGAGAAGSFAASELHRLGFAGKVTLLTREDRLPYDKPNLSKDYLAGKAPAEWIPLLTQEEYAERNIDLRLSANVDSIDAQRREIRVNGEVLQYDKLILATGSSPRKLDTVAPVHYLRTWNDADALRAATENAKNAVIIGASFIGLEAAASLRERGVAVTVIGTEEHPLEKILGAEVGSFIRRTHESHGVRFRLGRRPVEVRSNAVVLDDGTTEECDVVIAGIGVVQNLELAQRAGLTIDRRIVVDEYLQTSDPNIFAAGDIATRSEHWVHAGRMGQAAARNAMGLREPFAHVPFFWSQHYDLVFAYVGFAARADDVQLFGSLDDTNAAAVYREDGRVTAVVTLFRDDVSLAVEVAMERGESSEAILGIVQRAF